MKVEEGMEVDLGKRCIDTYGCERDLVQNVYNTYKYIYTDVYIQHLHEALFKYSEVKQNEYIT